MKNALSIKLKMTDYGVSSGIGRTVSTATMSRFTKQAAYAQLNIGRKALRRSAAYCRTVMRNGMKKGTTTQKVVNRGGRSITVRKRKPSAQGKPPNYHNNNGRWNLRKVHYYFPNRDKAVIGTVAFRSKGAKNVSFNIHEMLETGGSGRVKVLQQNANVKETKSLWGKISNAGGKWPTMWVGAKYPARPYTEPAYEPTMKFFNSIYGK